MKLPASSVQVADRDIADAKRRVIQGILPPGYTAMDDGSVVDSSGKVIVLPESMKKE